MKRFLSFGLCLLIVFSLLTGGQSMTVSAASEFTFKNTMSETVLKKYLSRAVTFQGLCAEGDKKDFLFEEDLRMIQRTGAKFISRAALFAWTSTNSTQVEDHYRYAKEMATKVHAADSEIILQGFVAEIVRKDVVEGITIPSWVFEAFGKPVQNRKFNYLNIIDISKKTNLGEGVNCWGTNAGYPDYSKDEALMWYYYCICRYIDSGYESIHIQEAEKTADIANVDKLLTMSRTYAKTHSRRGLVLFHNFFSMTTGGNKIGNRLLFDIQGNGLVPNETVLENGIMKCKISYPSGDYWCTWFGRSSGGQHPLGFTVGTCPTILEFDNYGQTGTLGVSNGPAFGTWGYDDITWFAVQPSSYRNEFLLYLDNYMKTNCLDAGKQAYFPVYPMRRVITPSPNYPTIQYKPGDSYSDEFIFDYCESIDKVGLAILNSNTYELTTKEYYRANRQSDGCPNGFGQEDTIRQIFLGKNASEDARYNTIILPSGYKPSGNASAISIASSHQSSSKVASAGSKGNAGTSTGANTSRNESAAGSNDTETSDDSEEPDNSSTGESFGLEDVSETPESSTPSSKPEQGANNTTVPIVLGIVAGILLLGGGAAVFFYIRRKKGS